VQQGPAGAVPRVQKWLCKAAAGACKRTPTLTAHPDLHLQCTKYAPRLCLCAQQARMRPQRQGRPSDGQPSPPSPMLSLSPYRWPTVAHEKLEHPWLGPGAIERGGRSPLALRANPRFHPSRWEVPCPPPLCSHPAHPPTVQPQQLRAGTPWQSRAPLGVSYEWGKQLMISEPKLARIRAPIRKRSAISTWRRRHPLAGCKPQWQGRKQADFQAPIKL